MIKDDLNIFDSTSFIFNNMHLAHLHLWFLLRGLTMKYPRDTEISITKSNGMVFRYGSEILGFTKHVNQGKHRFYMYNEFGDLMMFDKLYENDWYTDYDDMCFLSRNDTCKVVNSSTSLPYGKIEFITYYYPQYSYYVSWYSPCHKGNDSMIIWSYDGKTSISADELSGMYYRGIGRNLEERPQCDDPDWVFNHQLLYPEVDFIELKRLLEIGDKIKRKNSYWIM